jgi:hypothetical protein
VRLSSECVFVPHAMLGLFAGDSRLLFFLMTVIWTTNHEPQSTSSSWIGANKIFRLTMPCCRRHVDAIRQFCSTAEAVKSQENEVGHKSRIEHSGHNGLQIRGKSHALTKGVDRIYRRINDSATSERSHKIGVLPAQCSAVRKPTQSLTPALDL